MLRARRRPAGGRTAAAGRSDRARLRGAPRSGCCGGSGGRERRTARGTARRPSGRRRPGGAAPDAAGPARLL